MIFIKRLDSGSPDAIRLASLIEFPGFDKENWFAYFDAFKDRFSKPEGVAATYLALRKQDPCKFGLKNWCPTLH